MGSTGPSKKIASQGQRVQVTLRRSPIGTPQSHRLVLRGLGLRHIRQTVIRPDTPQVQGMIRKVGYLLEVGRP
jgi:large subunit ribosomal protein L30